MRQYAKKMRIYAKSLLLKEEIFAESYLNQQPLKSLFMYQSTISPREQEVLRLIAYENTSQEIASKLYISNHTANSHRKNLMSKLDVRNTAGLVRKGFELGLLRVAVCMITLLFVGDASVIAQVLNGNVNYQVRTAGASWQADSDPFSAGIESWDFGQEEINYKVAACVDDNNTSNFLAPDGREDYDDMMTTCGESFLCYFENQNCPTNCNFSFDDLLLNETNRVNGKYDLEWRSWEDDTACCFNSCSFGGEGNPTRDVISSIRDVKDNLPNQWVTTTTTQRANTATYSWKSIWRYTAGRRNSPLQFGLINSGVTKSHANSNRPAPVSTPTDLGYKSDWPTNDQDPTVGIADVTYSFEINDIAKGVSIILNNASFTPRVYLYDNSDNLIASKDQFFFPVNINIVENLCPGTYKVVVEGRSLVSHVGLFTLSVGASSLTLNGGEVTTALTEVCEAAPYSITLTESVPHGSVEGEDPTYQWESKLSTETQWTAIVGKTSNTLELTNQTMGSLDVQYRRKLTYCGVEAYSNIRTVQSISNVITGGTIKHSLDNLYIRRGHEVLSNVVNEVISTGDPLPINYKWIKSKMNRTDTLDNGSGLEVSGGDIYNMSLDLTEPNGEQSDFGFLRLSSNGCDAQAESNRLEFKVLAANGSISGKVSAPNGGSPIRGVSVCATVDGTFGDSVDRTYASVNGAICDTTDAFGDYKIENLYTGNPNNPGVKYNVEPFFLDHVFEKPVASAEGGDSVHVVTLTNNNQAFGKDFEDLTVISVQGNVHHDFSGTNFGKKGVKMYAELLVSGFAVPRDSTTTDADGNYALALPNPGEYIIRPEFDRLIATSNGPLTQEHLFFPEKVERTFVNDTIINFVDQSYETIVIRYGGACERGIGTCLVNLIDRDNNNTIIANQTVGENYTEVLVPARDYNIDILNEGYSLAGGVDESVVEGQLDEMANDSAKVAFDRDSITISITEKPRVSIQGLDNYINPGCAVGTGLHNLPIIEQHRLYPDIKVDVFEGPSDVCPLDTGMLQVIVGTRTLPELTISNGKAKDFLLKGGLPVFTAPYTMAMTISAQDMLNQNSEPITESFVTVGSKSKGTDFLSLSPELPFMILHDPPTDAGTAFWENSRSFSTTSTTYVNHSEGGGAFTKLQVGAKFETGINLFGIHFAIEGEFAALADFDLSAIHTTNSSESTNITTTINKKIETDPSEDFIGDDADIVMTMILAKTFAESDILSQEGCEIKLSTDFAISKDSITATSYRTIRDIKEIIIPDLETVKMNTSDPLEAKAFDFSIQQWRDIIAANEEEKRKAFIDNPSDSIKHIAVGSGVTSSFSEGRETSYSSSFEYYMEVAEEFAVGSKIEVGGSGAENRVYGKFRQQFTTEPSRDTDESESITVGYTLSDDDAGDQYLIGVYEDSRYGTPMFNVLAGSSSCPYVEYNEEEPLVKTHPYSIVPVDETPSIANDVDPTIGTTFQFRIFNHSTSDIDFLLRKDFTFGQSSEVRINSSLSDLVPVTVVPDDNNSSLLVLVAVKRTIFSGPDNETVKVRIAPDCGGSFEGNNEEVLTFTVNYASTISPVTMVTPTPNQIVNIASENLLKIKMTDYVKADFDNLGLQYAKQGSGSLKDAVGFNFVSGDLNNDAVLGSIRDWDLSEVKDDGVYEIKLKTTKNGSAGSNGSGLVSILIDREKPIVFGLPEPIDDHYDQSANDILSVSYNENIRASTSGVMVEIENLITGDIIPATVTIFENRVKIVDNTALSSLPSSAYRVTLSGIEDLAGNPADTYRWVFVVGDYNNINLSCIAELFVGNNNLDQNSINVTSYRARLINSDGVIDGYGTTSYKAQEEVNLDQGFEVTNGGGFEAIIEECTSGGN